MLVKHYIMQLINYKVMTDYQFKELSFEEQKDTNGGGLIPLILLAMYVGYKDAEAANK